MDARWWLKTLLRGLSEAGNRDSSEGVDRSRAHNLNISRRKVYLDSSEGVVDRRSDLTRSAQGAQPEHPKTQNLQDGPGVMGP